MLLTRHAQVEWVDVQELYAAKVALRLLWQSSPFRDGIPPEDLIWQVQWDEAPKVIDLDWTKAQIDLTRDIRTIKLGCATREDTAIYWVVSDEDDALFVVLNAS